MQRLAFVLLLALVSCASAPPSADDGDQVGAAGVAEAGSASGKFYREGLSRVDFSGLDAVAKERALKILNGNGCDCSCGMTIAQCRVEDQSCSRSPVLANAVTSAIRSGKTDQQAVAALESMTRKPAAAAAPAAGAGAAQPGVPVASTNLNLDGSPSMGPENAAVTVVTWEDFQ
jgi:hypothetical protein